MPGAPIIELRNLGKHYGNTVALNDINLDILDNEAFALLGPNGAGKTTLLHILCSILTPDTGTAIIAGFDVVRQPLKARKHLGVVFQEPSLDDRLTVYENLDFHCLIYQVPARERKARIADVLDLVELSDWRDRLVRTLSSGMKRRLEIARALVHDSRIVFLDEPTVGLDVQSRARIWDYLNELRQRRRLTLVVTTHYIEEVENCDRACIIDQGQVMAIGTPTSLKAEYGHRSLRVIPIDDGARREILAAYPESIQYGDEVVIPVPDDQFAGAFLARYGNRVGEFVLDTPSLEQVFLALTGRALRDKEASGRERTYAFGQRGGEHTR
ncbi:ABC transporter ATP-binding protein [Paradevosia shaoguanensis]|uniref:ABC transporter ATP-binding protein n=1 Tax=Paradevosia shaoguanensis TaxID=1335043 RepID=A0AA41QQJ5_9HYPH|nr:ABC transporter ATP-binding protein [Paradevosia shaoguanensis]MBI4045831.1 ABC transporter ATP-binding protein [Devosia nanyangense]MCF1744255.1 ABC transporter ATP-binding protein [Paradevosia shaoguanensis]MCI0128738.1 ABC transporter ATP-binding protein [Paradevosia shaoguanensis]